MSQIKKIPGGIFRILDKKPYLFLIAVSLILNCIIEVLGRRSVQSLAAHILTRPHVFLLNTAIIACTMSAALLVKRRAFTVVMISFLWTLCGITNCALMSFRASPFTARDILLAGAGLRIADVYLSKTAIILISAGLLLIIAGAVFAFIKLPLCYSKSFPVRLSAAAIPLALILVFALNSAAGNSDILAESENILEAYDDIGFAYCFTASIVSSGIDKPEDYSAETVMELLPSLDAETPNPVRPVNVIFVQLESFFDPSRIAGLNLSENPVPFFSALRDKYPSGYLGVPSLGGGTANTEFEVLTGMTLDHFAIGEYPYESILRERGCESIAYNLKKLGYSSHAIHNHAGSFYSRNIVYSKLGFDRFVSLEYMQNAEYNPTGWAKDMVLADYISKCLKTSKGPDFVFAVTVQGHGKYPGDFDNMPFTVEENENLDYLDTGALEYFLTQLNETDAFIGKLTETLESIPEDTVMVLYGDHLPSLSIAADQLESGSLYMTEYVIWSNFELGAEDGNLDAPALSAYVLGLLNINEGLITKFHQSYGGGDGDEALRLLEYDMLYGERYAEGGKDAYLPARLKMGIDRIRIGSVYTYGGYSYVYGINFTPYSVIYVNDQRKETEHLGDSALRTPYIFGGGDSITVRQTGPDRIELSSTEEFILAETPVH